MEGERRSKEWQLAAASSQASCGHAATAQPGRALVAAWPSRLRHEKGLLADPQARARAETSERERWVKNVAEIVQEAS